MRILMFLLFQEYDEVSDVTLDESNDNNRPEITVDRYKGILSEVKPLIEGNNRSMCAIYRSLCRA